jgi:two-component system cell cycle response regulator
MSINPVSISLLGPPQVEGHVPRQVMIAEDDPMFRKILQSWLREWGYKVTVVEDGAQAWESLQQEPSPELLILDWVMPEVNGLELCRRIRERGGSPYQYIMLVTGKDAKQDIVTGFDAGADDYITKPIDRDELQARLRVGNRILSLQRGLIAAREEVAFQATHDLLTGIWNRRAVLDWMHRECQRANRAHDSVAVLMLDVDHFKTINDTYGHLAGDQILRDVANRLMQNVRSFDIVGRYGGEEFLIVLPGCDESQILQSADRLRAAISSEPMSFDTVNVAITASIGATVVPAHFDATQTEILLAADKALYDAKNNGRNRVAVMSLQNPAKNGQVV